MGDTQIPGILGICLASIQYTLLTAHSRLTHGSLTAHSRLTHGSRARPPHLAVILLARCGAQRLHVLLAGSPQAVVEAVVLADLVLKTEPGQSKGGDEGGRAASTHKRMQFG